MKNSKSHLWNHLYIFLLILVLISSVYIRFDNLGERSLWLDEAWVANAITMTSEKGLGESSLTAPLFFVFSIHIITSLFGNNEFSLRLLPCLFGIGTLIIFYLIIRKHAGKTAVFLSLLMLSLSYNFVYYSKELKQYTAAMFFAVLLIYFCERVVIFNKARDWASLLILSIFSVGFDHSLFFIIPALFLALLISFPLSQSWKKILVYGCAVLTSSALLFLFHIRHQISQNIESIQRYWLSYYPQLSSLSAFMKWLLSSIQKIFDFFSLPYFSLSLVIVIVGLSLFYKHSHKRFLVYILLPFILVLGVSFLKRYPFGGSRLMLFAAPLLYLSWGKGLDFIFTKLGRSRLLLPLLIIILFLGASPVVNFVDMVRNPLRLEELRPLLDKMQTHVKLQDKIYVYYGAVEAFKYYYKTKYSGLTEPENIIWGYPHRGETHQYARDLDKHLKENMRIWLVFSHCWGKEQAYIIDYLSQHGKLQKQISDVGTSAHLFKIASNFE